MTADRFHERLHHLAEMTLPALRALDRADTVVLLPVGMLEVHGEHLPLGTDTYAVEAVTLAAAAWLLDHRPALHVLVLPAIPYGVDPVDRRRPDLFVGAGSVWVEESTLRALVRDVVGRMIGYGFRQVFPVGFHGGAAQSRALAEVSRELQDEHPGLVMYEPVGYVMAGAAPDVKPGLATLLGRPLTVREEMLLTGSIHASMFETSMMLHLRPDLVDPAYIELGTVEWHQLYSMPGWPGYVGAAPAHADAELGAAALRWRGVRAAALIDRALDGEDLSTLPRHPAPPDPEIDGDAGDDFKGARRGDVPATVAPDDATQVSGLAKTNPFGLEDAGGE